MLLAMIPIWLLIFPVLSDGGEPCVLMGDRNGRFHLETKDDLATLTFKNETSVTPYIGAGIGREQEKTVQMGIYDLHSERTQENQGYKIGFGMICSVSQNTGLILGYQWNTGSVTEPPATGTKNLNSDQENHLLSVGVKVNF